MALKTRKPARTLTGPELCERLDINRASLSKYCKAGMPHNGVGKARRFDIAEVTVWMQSNRRGGDRGRPAAPVSDELQRLRCLKEKALIRKYTRECEQAEGRLVDVGDVIEKYTRLRIEIRQRMHELPMRILSFPGLDMTNGDKGRIDREICEMMDDCIRQVGDAMREHTTPYEQLTLDKKPLATELE